jgi:non-ribosomal peptide synthase protein (TIGR01720 family)
VHHLAVDAVSWGILLEDLATAYLGDRTSDLPQTTPFLRWAEVLSRAAAAGRFDEDAASWTSRAERALPLPREMDGPFIEARAETVDASLSEDETHSLLHDAHAAWNTQVEDVLFTALARVVARWIGSGSVRIGLERHGREALVEGMDLSRTVGWFTSYFPVVVDVDPAREPGLDLRDVKDCLRSLPRRGASFGVLRYLRSEPVAQPLRNAPEPEVVFNYAGRIDSNQSADGPWRTDGLPFASRAPENERRHRIEVNTFIRDGVLRVLWSSSSSQYRSETARHLTQQYLDEVRAIVRHGVTAQGRGFTPADFPDAGLRQDELDRLLRELGT